MKIDKAASGQKLKKIMQEKNMSAKTLSQYLGVSVRAVYNYLSGKNLPTVKHALVIGYVLGISQSDYVVWEDEAGSG